MIYGSKRGGVIIARRKRVWYPGAMYHLMERGIRRKEIFKDDTDYQVFLAILKNSLAKNECMVHAYCLMTNHFHILLETSEIEVGRFMKHLASCYAIYFNRKYTYKGHLFEGRYKSCLVRDDAYFLQTSRYIHLNPVKAKMVEHPEDYLWSSYRTMLGICDDKITRSDRTRSFFKDQSVIRYREFVEDVGHRYVVQEDEIRKSMGEDDLWLPW